MDEKNSQNKPLAYQGFFIQVFSLIIVLFGCLSFFCLFFYYPLLSALGFIGTILFLSITSVLSGVLANSGFKYASSLAKLPNTSWFEMLTVYAASLTLAAVCVGSVVRVVPWSLNHFLQLEIRWTEPPK